jgi:hypothetical protein
MESNKIPHRDDLSPELLEVLTKLYPGVKIICAGDIPYEKLPKEVKEAFSEMSTACDLSLVEGSCIDCGVKMPNYSPESDDWQPTQGWSHFEQGDEIVAWQCPDCDQKEEKKYILINL